MTVPVEVSDAMRPGVVSLPHGWGHDRDGVRLGVARAHAGASANDVTSDRHLDTLSGNAAFNGLPVTVRRQSPSPRAAADHDEAEVSRRITGEPLPRTEERR